MIRKFLFIVSLCVISSLVSSEATNQGLVAHWLANRIAGQELLDQVGGGSHARVIGEIATRRFG